ncbi:MAG: hypothetical protein CMF51_02875 [Legionellales bacterium]|nr:hypothetical protein [Legionellales bacterium]
MAIHLNFLKNTLLIFYCLSLSMAFAQPPCHTFKIKSNLNSTEHNTIKLYLNEYFKQQSIPSLLDTKTSIRRVTQKALQPYGYFTPHIQIDTQVPPQQTCARHLISIQPGPLTHFKSIRLHCGHTPTCVLIQSALHDMPAQLGAPFTTEQYEKTLEQLLNIAIRKGYYHAHGNHSTLTINPNTQSAYVDYTIDLGPKLKLSSLILQDTQLSPTLVQRYLSFESGAPYSNQWLEQAQMDLLASDYFNRVEVNPLWSKQTQNTIPISVKVKEKKPIDLLAGIGYDSDTDFKALFGFKQRLINRFGHRFQSTAMIGQQDRHFTAQYDIPGYHPAFEHFSFETKRQSYLNRGFGHSRYWLNKLQFKRLKSDRMIDLTLNLLNEHSTPLVGLYQNTRLLYTELNAFKTFEFKYFSYHTPIQLKFQMMGRIASHTHDITSHFQQAQLKARALMPLTDEQQLILSTQFSRSFVSNLSEVPISLQFATGGAQSLRGYAYNSLGPSKNLNVSNLEYRLHLKDEWYAACFVDRANLSVNLKDNVHHSIGAGIVWTHPVAHVSLGLARALSLPQRPLRFYLSVST